jgi:putative ABC transport system permease protein
MTTLRAALWLLRDVTLPALRRHLLRSVLTLVGIIIGTQVVVAISVINRSALACFEHTFETLSGGAQLQVSNGSAGVPESLIEKLAATAGVESASGLLEGRLRTPQGELSVFGVDLLGDQSIRTTQFPKEHVHIPDTLAFVNAPDSIALSTTFAERAGLRLNDTLAVVSPVAAVSLVVRGFLDPIGPAALFGGAVGLVDLPTAERLFGRPDRVDQIDVRLVDKHAVASMQEVLAGIVAGSGTVEPPRSRAATLGSMLSAVQAIFTLLSLSAIVVGAFIIQHTMQTAITQRRHELAIARAVGYERRVVLLAILIEGLGFGVLGSLLGALLGIVGARMALAMVTSGVSAIWARVDAGGLTLAPLDFALAFILGIGSTMAAVLPSARRAARTPVLYELRAEPQGLDRSSSTVRSVIVGAALTLAGYALFWARPDGYTSKVGVIITAVVLVAIGYAQLIPLLSALVFKAARPIGRRLRGVSATLAIDNLARDPAASSGAVAALMLAFALVLIVSAFVLSLRTSLLTWLDQTLASDLYVAPSMQLDLPSGPTMPAALEARIRALPGVSEVSVSRMLNVRVGSQMAVLRTESAGGFQREHYPVVAGSPQYREAFARGEAVVVSDNFRYRHGLGAGDMLTIDTPFGPRAFPIAAVVVDYTLDIGTIIIAYERYKELWGDELANSFRVWTDSPAKITALREVMAEQLPTDAPLVVLTGAEFKANVADALDNALLMTYAVEIVAIVIAVIGVLNFFLAEIVNRRREIGLLRSVALTRRQLVRTLACEALLVGVLGGIVAIVFAWPVSMLLVTHSTRLISGWRLGFKFPVALSLATCALAGMTALLGAFYPARTVARQKVAALLTSE